MIAICDDKWNSTSWQHLIEITIWFGALCWVAVEMSGDNNAQWHVPCMCWHKMWRLGWQLWQELGYGRLLEQQSWQLEHGRPLEHEQLRVLRSFIQARKTNINKIKVNRTDSSECRNSWSCYRPFYGRYISYHSLDSPAYACPYEAYGAYGAYAP